MEKALVLDLRMDPVIVLLVLVPVQRITQVLITLSWERLPGLQIRLGMRTHLLAGELVQEIRLVYQILLWGSVPGKTTQPDRVIHSLVPQLELITQPGALMLSLV
ncbi:hypothetical protein [Spirosoma sp. KUDC1026]|uniref:hypothetical protein n=1 Tax=Spirosoma sp. KUDC1026 TaxID=2745947 RepID=UPI00159BB09A|nr:hypothetical protein [Spirosoma sp. KUDC1026]QKZ11938.1 hypothetical protein HU175_04545 [Spirosoma sp. KUDC1026]